MQFRILILALFLAFCQAAVTFAGQFNFMEPVPKKQFIYVLKLHPDYKSDSSWTPEANQTVGNHFNYLQALTEKGTVVLAGRSDYDVTSKDLFGMVVLETKTPEEALAIMQNDPAVLSKIMTAELHPFRLALLRK
jgi:uncharacterized protein YciI